jgi:hypothetical protein
VCVQKQLRQNVRFAGRGGGGRRRRLRWYVVLHCAGTLSCAHALRAALSLSALPRWACTLSHRAADDDDDLDEDDY